MASTLRVVPLAFTSAINWICDRGERERKTEISICVKETLDEWKPHSVALSPKIHQKSLTLLRANNP